MATEMRTIPNSMVSTLVRCLPIIITNIDGKKLQSNLRLNNAVRQVKLIIKRLERIDNGTG